MHRLRLIVRLSEDPSIYNHCRVRREHGQLLTRPPDHKRLLPRKPDDVVAWSLPSQKCLVDIRTHYQVRYPNL